MPFYPLFGVFLLLLPFTMACPQEIASVCQKCQLWLEGMQLDCSFANFTQVTEVLKSISSPIQLLEIHNTDLGGVLRADDLKGLFIKQLDLSGNKLKQIEKGSFSDALQVLRLANNSISIFPDLKGLRQLQALDLSGNTLGAIPDKAFMDTLGLKQLRLERNNICVLSPEALEETKTYLELLDLSDNCLSFVPAKNLRGAQRLTYLDLSNNKISDIPSMQFMNMPLLKEVRLSGNRISTMTPLSFMNVRNLQQLDLSNNRLSNILINQFQGFAKIITIDLSHNALKKIQTSAFKDLDSIEQLDLSHNRIESIQTLSFSNCQRLQTLSLQNNQINQLFKNSFHSLDQLTTLNLANNSLSTAGSGMFSGMPNLKQLYLRNNKIINMDDDAFSQLSQLTTLDLGENSLSRIPKPAFNAMNKLFWLDICCNDIRTIEDGTFKRKVANILLQSNPLQCDDKFDPFINYLVINNIRTFLPEQKEVVCSGPPNMAGVRLKDVMITKANDTLYRSLEQLVPGSSTTPLTGTGTLLGNLVPGLDAIPGLGNGIPGLTSSIPGLQTVTNLVPGLKDVPGLNVISNPLGGLDFGSSVEGDFGDALKSFADPLARMASGRKTSPGDMTDLISSIPDFVGQLPSYPGIDLKNIPPEIISTVLSGGEIPGVPKSISDSYVKQYLQKMAATALATNRGLPAPANGVTELPPLTSLPPEFVNGVLQGQNLPGLTGEQTTAIKDHYLNQMQTTQKPVDGQIAPSTLVTAGEPNPINLSPAELLRFLPKNFDLSQLPPPVLQDLAAGKTPKLSDLPQSLIDSLTANPDLAAYIKQKEQLKPMNPVSGVSDLGYPKLNADDILGKLPPTVYPGSDETYVPYDINSVDRQTDLKGEEEDENSMTAVYVAIALAMVGSVTLGILGYFCWKKHNGSLPGTDDFDRAKFFGISPKSSFDSNSLPFQNNNRAPTPSFMIPPNQNQSSFLDLYGGNVGSNGWIYDPNNAPGHTRTEM